MRLLWRLLMYSARFMRDKGWNGVDDMIASGISGGDVLEIGPGPGYVGLEVVRKSVPRRSQDVRSAQL